MNKRKEVLEFAEAMEKVLRENDDKTSWKECELNRLEMKLLEEVAEYFSNQSTSDGFFVITKFVKELSSFHGKVHESKKEMVDIGNVAMMIRDKLIQIEKAKILQFPKYK